MTGIKYIVVLDILTFSGKRWNTPPNYKQQSIACAHSVFAIHRTRSLNSYNLRVTIWCMQNGLYFRTLLATVCLSSWHKTDTSSCLTSLINVTKTRVNFKSWLELWKRKYITITLKCPFAKVNKFTSVFLKGVIWGGQDRLNDQGWFARQCMGHIYLSHSIAIYACLIPWDSYCIIIILIWNTIQLKLLNLWKFRLSIY